MRVLLAACCLLLLLVPGAAAEAYYHARLTPVANALTLGPGQRATLEYDWSLDFENTTCSSPAEVAVDFVVDDEPVWVGSSFEPMGAKAFSPRASGKTRLEVLVDSEGPQSAEGRIRLSVGLNPYTVANCAPTPRPLSEGANITLNVAAASAPVTETSRHGGTPAPSWLAALAAVAFALTRRR